MFFSVSVIFPESKAGISSQIKSDILELDSHSSSDDIILLDGPRADKNSCDPICYQSVEEIPYQVSNPAREYSSQNPGQSFGSSNCTLPNQVSTQISNKVSSQAHEPSTQTEGSSFETPITMFPVHVSVSTSNRVPNQATKPLNQTAGSDFATSSNTFPVSRKRKSVQDDMAKERQEFVKSISDLVKTRQDSSSKAIDSSMIQAFITKTAELTAKSMIESMKDVVGEGSKTLSNEDKTTQTFLKYVEIRFQQWGPAKRKRGYTFITEALEKVEELEEDNNI